MFRNFGCVLVAALVLNVGCKRDSERETVTDTVPSNPAVSVPPATVVDTTSTVPSAQPPTSFERANAVSIGNSEMTACTLRVVPGWAEIRCEARNAEGGALIGARIKRGAQPGAAADVRPAVDGSLTLVLPWLKGHQTEVRFDWVDMTFDLLLAVRGAKFTRVLPTAQAEQCERFANTSEQILAGIRAKIGPFSPAVTPKDVYRFPALGRCHMAGKSAWALSLEQLAASGEGPNREVVVTLGLNRVDATGLVTSFKYEALTFAPEGLQIPDLMSYDYDADGEAEVIVRQDILIRATGSLSKLPARVPGVFTYKQNRVQPYQPLGALTNGGILAEQLDPDGRPEVGDYGPFLAWLPEDCGRGDCPRRLTGPRFFLRSTPGGGFSADDGQTDGVIRTKCERTPKDLVVDVRTASGKQKTALHIACARVRGDSTESILAQLSELKTEMCLETQPNCPLYTALAGWARAMAPRQVQLPVR